MADVTCPKCGTVISLAQSEIDAVVRQVRDEEFERELRERLNAAEADKRRAVQLAEEKLRSQQLEEAARKDAKHADMANEFINFIHRPEIYAMFLDYFRFPCFVNPAAEQYMTTTPMYEAGEMLNCELKLDLGEGLDKYNGIWQDVRFAD